VWTGVTQFPFHIAEKGAEGNFNSCNMEIDAVVPNLQSVVNLYAFTHNQ